MTPDQKYEIATLAEDYDAKASGFRMQQLLNHQTDPEKRRQQAIDYHIAETEMLEALARLQAAQRSIVGQASRIA